MTLQALLWDVDGTLAETERDGHRVAFNQAFESLGLSWRWDEVHYGRLLAVSGGRERLLHDMSSRSDAPALSQQRETLAVELHALKNRFYADRVAAGHVALRPGVRQAITTTTSRSNVEALLKTAFGGGWAEPFDAVVCGEDVRCKKPDPEVFLLALQRLQIGPLDAIAIEDSPGGVAAARAAQVPVLVTLSSYFQQATVEAALAIGPGLGQRRGWRPALVDEGPGRVTLDDLLQWRERADSVSQHA